MVVPMRKSLCLFALVAGLPISTFALDDGIAIVTKAGSSIQSGTEIRRDLLGECISKLPSEADLAPISTSTEKFLRKLDGTDRDDYGTLWTTTIQIGYQVRQRFLYVVGTKGVGATAAPQFRNDSAQFFASEEIVSDPSVSKHFHGASPRTRYFANAQDAEASARVRAAARLKELKANLCSER